MKRCVVIALLLQVSAGILAGTAGAQTVPCPDTCPGGGRAYLCVCPAQPPAAGRPMPPPSPQSQLPQSQLPQSQLSRPPSQPDCEASRGPDSARPAECRTRNWIRASNQDCLVYNPNPVPNETIVWEGTCVGGYAEGAGVLRWYLAGKPNGVDEGIWRHGMLSGRATALYGNGTVYVGNWVNSRQHGLGTEYYPDGTRKAGRFAEGSFAEPVVIRLCNESSLESVAIAIGWLRLGIWRAQGWFNVQKDTCRTLSSVLPESEFIYVYAQGLLNGQRTRWEPDASDSNSRAFCVDANGRAFDFLRSATCNGETRRFFERRMTDGLRTSFTVVD